MKNQRGQVAVELVLMSIVLMAIILSVTEKIRKTNALANLVDGPWGYIDGMARHGAWAQGNSAADKDPNLSPRRASLQGEVER